METKNESLKVGDYDYHPRHHCPACHTLSPQTSGFPPVFCWGAEPHQASSNIARKGQVYWGTLWSVREAVREVPARSAVVLRIVGTSLVCSLA